MVGLATPSTYRGCREVAYATLLDLHVAAREAPVPADSNSSTSAAAAKEIPRGGAALTHAQRETVRCALLRGLSDPDDEGKFMTQYTTPRLPSSLTHTRVLGCRAHPPCDSLNTPRCSHLYVVRAFSAKTGYDISYPTSGLCRETRVYGIECSKDMHDVAYTPPHPIWYLFGPTSPKRGRCRCLRHAVWHSNQATSLFCLPSDSVKNWVGHEKYARMRAFDKQATYYQVHLLELQATSRAYSLSLTDPKSDRLRLVGPFPCCGTTGRQM